MLTYEGNNLEQYKRNNLKIQPQWNKRDFTFRVEQYLQSTTEKVLAIGGLRGTGKTVGILQAADNYDAMYILAQKESDATGRDYINLLKSMPNKVICIDEYSWIKDRKDLDYYLINAIQDGKRIVITGTESITLDYLNYGSLIHRVDMIHTTMFPFDEYKRIYNLADSQKVCDKYLIEGGLFKEYAIKDYSTMKEYVETAIVENLAGYLNKEMSEEKARTLTYAVLFKAVCPSNLSSVPVLRESNVMLPNFLDAMGINTSINIDERDLNKVADIFEHTGIIKRIKNFDQKSSIKEQYYITNPSLTSQLIKTTYGLTSLDDATLGHVFESCAMVQLANNKISEHEIYFINTEGRSNIPKKELDIVITDEKEEHVYFFECKHSQSDKIKTNSTILTGYIEDNYFQDADIDGRYVIYNGDFGVKKYDVGNVVFTPLDSNVDNYFQFKEYVKAMSNTQQLHVNKHSPFEDPERASVEQKAIDLVENKPEILFEKYKSLDESFNGRYINSDLFKEVFEDYSTSPANRTVFNVPVHNSAAVLANALFREMVTSDDNSHGSKVLFITGIPGAGKTTAIQGMKFDFNNFKVVYEGQLSTFEQAKEKIAFCLQNKCEVDIVAFHRKPEKALFHTILRYYKIGRGASITAMSNIQGGMADSFEKIFNEFGNTARIRVVDLDNSMPYSSKESVLQVLRKEGDKNAIRERLTHELNRLQQAGCLTESAYNESAGRSPKGLSGIRDDIRGSEGCRQALEREFRSYERECQQTLVDVVRSDQNLRKFEQIVKDIHNAKIKQFYRLKKSIMSAIKKLDDKIDLHKKNKPGFFKNIFDRKSSEDWLNNYKSYTERITQLRSRIRNLANNYSDSDLQKLACAQATFKYPQIAKEAKIEKEIEENNRKSKQIARKAASEKKRSVRR